MKSTKVLVSTVALILVAVPMCAQAGFAVDFMKPTVDSTNGTWSLGWAFTLNESVMVDALGFYDDQKNGLAQSHDVGIFDAGQNLVVSGTVTPNDPLGSWWRWTSVTPTVLVTGQEYRIAAVTGAENYTWNPSGFVVDPRVNFLNSVYVSSGALEYPITTEPTVGYFGPNFSMTPIAVPAPGALLLLVPGVAGVLRLRRKLA